MIPRALLTAMWLALVVMRAIQHAWVWLGIDLAVLIVCITLLARAYLRHAVNQPGVVAALDLGEQVFGVLEDDPEAIVTARVWRDDDGTLTAAIKVQTIVIDDEDNEVEL